MARFAYAVIGDVVIVPIQTYTDDGQIKRSH